jgi:drug/metabolite transporter (DMT)-like permease
MPSPKNIAYIELHIAIFLFGFTAILGKLIQLSEFEIVWYRLIFTSISLLFIPRIFRYIKSIPARERWKLAGIGMIVTLHWICFYGSIKYANVTVALSVLSTTAFFTAILEPLMLKTRFSWTQVILGVMIIPGMFLIFSFGSIYITGIILALFAAILASLFSVLNKRMVQKHHPLAITFIELGSGWLFLTIIFPFYFLLSGITVSLPSAHDFLYLVILALLCTTIAYYLALKALKHLSAFTSNISINLEPVYGIIMAMLIFSEQKEMNIGFYLGAVIIILSIFIHTFLEYRKKDV